MKNLKKILIITISIFYLTSCGFSPIYSKKESDFQINDIKFVGNNKIKSILLSKLTPYKNNKENKKDYLLKVNASHIVNIVSKNKKGEAEVFKISIFSKIDIYSEDNLIITKNYNNSLNFSNEEKKIRLKEVENQNLSILSSKLAEQIILTLILLSSDSSS